jgi:hypothetical protein
MIECECKVRVQSACAKCVCRVRVQKSKVSGFTKIYIKSILKSTSHNPTLRGTQLGTRHVKLLKFHMTTKPNKVALQKNKLVCFCGLCRGTCSFKDRQVLEKHFQIYGEWDQYALAKERLYQQEQENEGPTSSTSLLQLNVTNNNITY